MRCFLPLVLLCGFISGSVFFDVLRGADPPLQLATAAKSQWPQWRGPRRDGQLGEVAHWPDKLSPEVFVQAWRVKLEPSYSGPIVSESLVFVTETAERKHEVVRALDRASGAQRWQATWPGAMTVPFFAKANGDWIRATPAYDGRTLFVAGMRDVLVAIDAASGEVRWRFDFVEQLGTPLPDFGFVSSPLVADDFVYVQAGAAVCKLEKTSGKLVWRVLQDDGGMFGSAFSSPRLVELAGQPQLLVQSRTKLAGLDPESGTVLWSQEIPAFRGMNILTPTIVGNTIFTSAYGGKSFLFACRREGEKLAVREAWTNQATGYMSSPVVIDRHIYLHLRNRRFTCLDLETGATRWTTEPFGEYWSMVANGDRILALDEGGELRLIHAAPERFDLLDSRRVSDESCWAHLAVSGDDVYVRDLHGLTAFRWHTTP